MGCGGVGMGPGVTGGISVGGRVDPGSGVGAPLGCGVGVTVLHTGVLQQGSMGSWAMIQ